MLINTVIIIFTVFIVSITLLFSIWTYVDTRVKYNHERFILDRENKRKKAKERFDEKWK
jgi:hypothetical protein